MKALFDALRRHAREQPTHVALTDGRQRLDYVQLLARVDALSDHLSALLPKTIALWADNSVDWAVADLAAARAEQPSVPLPVFFSPAQTSHAIAQAGVDLVLTDQPEALRALRPDATLLALPNAGTLRAFRLPQAAPAELPDACLKITFTSGTTGAPKGVCLGAEALSTVAQALARAGDGRASDRHLCLLPLATLLENVGGLYAPLLVGATVCVPSLAEVGLKGSSGLDVVTMLGALGQWQASTAIMVPQMLQAVLAAARAGLPLPRQLRYLALGGAPVAATLLATARELGLPVFEGYGLSECASVVAVNTPHAHKPGSVGRPLPHVQLRIDADGEIHVGGIGSLGYLGEPARAEATPVATGDLGYLDADGFLYLTGRKKHIFITAFGRNVAPEWVERELLGEPEILQAAVFGESRPYNCAVVVSRPGTAPEHIGRALAAANARLPDYARVHEWIAAHEPFTPANGMSTANGRLRRSVIGQTYAERIAAVYPN